MFLSAYEFNDEVEVDENGKLVGSVEEINFIVADGDSLDEFRMNLAKQLVEYARDYMSEYTRYFNAPNTIGK